MKKDDVRFFIDDEEVSHNTFQEVPIDVEASAKIEEEWIRNQRTGGGAET